MLVIRRLLAAIMFLAMATALRAETYRDWEKAPPDASPIVFKKWLQPTTSGTTIEGRAYSVFESPVGHLFGHIDLSAFPPTAFPLNLRVLYYRLGSAARNSVPNGFNPKAHDWTSPIGYVAPNASLGELIESREVSIHTPAESAAIPVWSIWTGGSRNDSDSYTVLVEVAAHDGSVLARRVLIEAVESGADRNPASNLALARAIPGGAHTIKDLGDLNTVDELPLEAQAYDGVKILYLDEMTLHDPTYTDDFWRQVFFAGVLVLGDPTEVQELAQRLGLQPNQRVLAGGLWTTDHTADDLTALIREASGQTEVDLKKGENPFARDTFLGQTVTVELRTFSLCFLGIFLVFEITIIIGSHYLLRGNQRVFRWLLIPLSAIAYTALGLVVVHAVVDFQPEVEILREIDSVEGWPQSLVSTDVIRLAFNDARTGFTTPAAAYRWSVIDADTTPLKSVMENDRTTFSMRQRYGRFAEANIQYWQPGENPCQITANREIVATRTLRGGWVWDGKAWRNLGPMEPGMPVSIDRAPVVVSPSKVSSTLGVIDQIAGRSFPGKVQLLCSGPYMTSLRDTNVGILIAVEDRPFPEKLDDAAGADVRPLTILAHQFTLPTPQP
jgi:hypothetical protein